MAKDKAILVEFDDDIISGHTGNDKAFKVKGNQYKYVGGPLLAVEYPVITTEVPLPPISAAAVDFNLGTHAGTGASGVLLTLEVIG